MSAGRNLAGLPTSPHSSFTRLELGNMSDVGSSGGDREIIPLINEDSTHRVYDGRPHDAWEFAGFGSRTKVDDLNPNEEGFREDQEARKQHHLGQFLATSISGTRNWSFGSGLVSLPVQFFPPKLPFMKNM